MKKLNIALFTFVREGLVIEQSSWYESDAVVLFRCWRHGHFGTRMV